MRQKPLRFEELLLPHLDGAYNLARWMVESDQDAQDIVQEAYIQARTEFGQFRGADARVWLLTIVREIAYTWTGSSRRNQSSMIPLEEAIHMVPLERRLLDPSSEERKRDLHEALRRLPVEFREILALRDIEGWSNEQLTSALKLSAAKVTSRLSQARLRLRRELIGVQRGKGLEE
jgi:RNA polymerase sigma-70 factor (ECF subfamily)